MRRKNHLIALIVILLLSPVASGVPVVVEDCGNVFDPGGVGPFDLRDPESASIMKIVIDHHWTPYIEDLAINGSTMRQPKITEEMCCGPDLVIGHLDYTLRAIPNHARALNAMAMYQLRIRNESMSLYNSKKRNYSFRSAECYFERAVTFRPDDGMVRMAYGVFLHKQERPELALENYSAAIQLMPDMAEPHYNIGLLYLEMNNYALARVHAKKAYELGYPFPGLKQALVARGEWEAVDDLLEAEIP